MTPEELETIRNMIRAQGAISTNFAQMVTLLRQQLDAMEKAQAIQYGMFQDIMKRLSGLR